MSGLTHSNLTFGATYVHEATGFTGKLVGYTNLWNGPITVTLLADDGSREDFDLTGVRFA